MLLGWRDSDLIPNFSGEGLTDNINLEGREGDGRVKLGMNLQQMV
jgi:hypothetical protein